MDIDEDVLYALLKLKNTSTFYKDLLKKGGLYPPQEVDLEIEIKILDSAIHKIKSKFTE